MTTGPRLRALIQRLIPSGGTTERVVKSGLWVMSQNAFGRVIQLAMLVILARLIGPSELGLMGIALLALSALNNFTKIGINAALIQQKSDNVDEYLNTAWVLNGARGVLIAAVLVAAAPLIGQLFSEPRATGIIRAIAITPLVLGLRNPGIVYFQKNLDFHKQFLYRVSGEMVQFCAAVGYALISPTAWAFVVGFVAGDAFRAAVSYLIHEYRPRLTFDREQAAELIDYGKWMTGSSILYFLYSEGDDAFVGWLINPAALAFYQYAYRFSNAPATEISQVVGSVTFPAFSKLQDDPDRLREGFLNTIRVISLVAFPTALGIAAVAPSFVRAFLGEQWVPMIAAMQILTVYGLLRAIGKTFGQVWKAIDRPDYITKLSFLRVVLLALLIYPATQRFGITGTALVVTGIYVFPMMPIDVYVIANSIGLSYRRLLTEFAYPLLASGAMAASTWYLGQTLQLRPLFEFGILVVAGVAVYAVAVLLLIVGFDWQVERDLRTILTSIRG